MKCPATSHCILYKKRLLTIKEYSYHVLIRAPSIQHTLASPAAYSRSHSNDSLQWTLYFLSKEVILIKVILRKLSTLFRTYCKEGVIPNIHTVRMNVQTIATDPTSSLCLYGWIVKIQAKVFSSSCIINSWHGPSFLPGKRKRDSGPEQFPKDHSISIIWVEGTFLSELKRLKIAKRVNVFKKLRLSDKTWCVPLRLRRRRGRQTEGNT